VTLARRRVDAGVQRRPQGAIGQRVDDAASPSTGDAGYVSGRQLESRSRRGRGQADLRSGVIAGQRGAPGRDRTCDRRIRRTADTYDKGLHLRLCFNSTLRSRRQYTVQRHFVS
jgi:hypothetical protein